jgi:hypothetical protein
MYTGIRDWKRFIRQCFDHVKPGSWVEISSVYPMPNSDDGTLSVPDAGVLEVALAFDDISRRIRANPEFQSKLRVWFEDQGFISIQEKILNLLPYLGQRT